ncbi:TIGR04197 family type VII secretion effector [Streptococcus acidominimus]|uniref:Type VII secretion effector n=1 Tax=Streptococcus acidominimus TaxID=1326 RepID=A0A1Q8EEU5_STRAI|nr:TIGR04197 family type VII secretion effector [Streptococcus acidominimus]OLF50312.1 hypothetical protein BU200_02800 [Streptococcus acidominimus]SUN06980.1 type VII secretion effector [Streptococcus acidominimus]
MVVLQNDTSTAGERATALANGVSALVSSGSVMLDFQTKLGGNEQAKEAIAKSQELASQLGTILSSMSSNIQSVSASFQAMDAQLGVQLQSTGFSLNEPK